MTTIGYFEVVPKWTNFSYSFVVYLAVSSIFVNIEPASVYDTAISFELGFLALGHQIYPVITFGGDPHINLPLNR
ncbi:hypothetical protein SAMN05216359_101382 [Roseateles sp. YR242]|nr:hypothetical protein SAMN05216359_101382 [Roseateles sp. YR242]